MSMVTDSNNIGWNIVNRKQTQFPFPGCRLEIISTDLTRYQGRLASVDVENKCVKLVEVHHFGTEGRIIGAAGAKPAKGELPSDVERIFFEQFIHSQRVVPPAEKEVVVLEESSSVGVADTAAPSQVKISNREMGNNGSSNAVFGGSNGFISVDWQQQQQGINQVEYHRQVKVEWDGDGATENAHKGDGRSGRDKANSSRSMLKRTGISSPSRGGKRRNSRNVSPQPYERGGGHRSHFSHSASQHCHSRSRAYSPSTSAARSPEHGNVPTSRHSSHYVDASFGGGFCKGGRHPRYFIAQLQLLSHGKRRAVGILVNGHLFHQAPVYIAFHFDDPIARDPIPTVSVGEVWQVTEWRWMPSRYLTYHVYSPSSKYPTLREFKADHRDALPWITDQRINTQAVAIGRGMSLVREPELVTRSAQITSVGSSGTGTGWLKRWVEVKAEGCLDARLDVGQFVGKRGRPIEELKRGSTVRITAVRLAAGCHAGPSYVLPDINYNEYKPPFKLQSGPWLEWNVVRSHEGDFFPVKIIDE